MRIPHENETRYVKEPPSVDDCLEKICEHLNVAVVFTMSSDLTSLLFDRIAEEASEITLKPNNITVPVVDSLQDLTKEQAGVRRRDFCCFVRESRLVLVWTNSTNEIMLESANVESKFMSAVRYKIPSFLVCPNCFRFGVKKSLIQFALPMLVETRTPPLIPLQASTAERKERGILSSLIRSILAQRMKSRISNPWNRHLAHSCSHIQSWSVLPCVY